MEKMTEETLDLIKIWVKFLKGPSFYLKVPSKIKESIDYLDVNDEAVLQKKVKEMKDGLIEFANFIEKKNILPTNIYDTKILPRDKDELIKFALIDLIYPVSSFSFKENSMGCLLFLSQFYSGIGEKPIHDDSLENALDGMEDGELDLQYEDFFPPSEADLDKKSYQEIYKRQSIKEIRVLKNYGDLCFAMCESIEENLRKQAA